MKNKMIKKIFPGIMAREFEGILLETKEKVSGCMLTYDVKDMKKGKGTCSQFILSKRLEHSYYELFYTLVLKDGREYTVYTNDEHDMLIQYDVSL